jgi:predicted nucleic acid-binding protein
MRFVLDASVALSWFLDRPVAQYAIQIRNRLLHGDKALVPELWQLEIANGFLVAERHRLFTVDETAEALQNLDIVVAQAVQSSPETISMRGILSAARSFGLTSYDALYLETARRQNLPLATLDRQLLAAASKAGIEIVQ